MFSLLTLFWWWEINSFGVLKNNWFPLKKDVQERMMIMYDDLHQFLILGLHQSCENEELTSFFLAIIKTVSTNINTNHPSQCRRQSNCKVKLLPFPLSLPTISMNCSTHSLSPDQWFKIRFYPTSIWKSYCLNSSSSLIMNPLSGNSRSLSDDLSSEFGHYEVK